VRVAVLLLDAVARIQPNVYRPFVASGLRCNFFVDNGLNIIEVVATLWRVRRRTCWPIVSLFTLTTAIARCSISLQAPSGPPLALKKKNAVSQQDKSIDEKSLVQFSDRF